MLDVSFSFDGIIIVAQWTVVVENQIIVGRTPLGRPEVKAGGVVKTFF